MFRNVGGKNMMLVGGCRKKIMIMKDFFGRVDAAKNNDDERFFGRVGAAKNNDYE